MLSQLVGRPADAFRMPRRFAWDRGRLAAGCAGEGPESFSSGLAGKARACVRADTGGVGGLGRSKEADERATVVVKHLLSSDYSVLHEEECMERASGSPPKPSTGGNRATTKTNGPWARARTRANSKP